MCRLSLFVSCVLFFFFNAPATTEIYTLSLHDALPICDVGRAAVSSRAVIELPGVCSRVGDEFRGRDRKSTRLNSSHPSISYAVFCLKKKNKKQQALRHT